MFDGMTTAQILQTLAPIIVAEIALKIFCYFKLSKDKVKYLPKWGWAVIITGITTIGSLVYLTIGRVRD